MKIEYEAKFADINKDEIRERLKREGARLVHPERLLKRYNFFFPEGHDIAHGWVRVRDEGDKKTMSIKVAEGSSIEGQKEACVVIDSIEEAIEFVTGLGCKQKAYQESLRETWELDGAEVVLDTWPFLEPLMEVEADSEERVKAVSGKLGLDYSQAKFFSTTELYAKKYNLPLKKINTTATLTFDIQNPFL